MISRPLGFGFLPSDSGLSGREAIRALEKLGFIVRRRRGSHVILRRGATGCVVPHHRELKDGTLNGVKQPGVSRDEFLAALGSWAAI
jgi:predicted RNA binding protein YcfA (HicA-like mRNA interferase family)